MDYSNELLIWDSAAVRIVGVKHGLLLRQAVSEVFQHSALVYVTGKSARLYVDDMPYSVKSNCLLHIGANKRIAIDEIAEELEYFFVTYQAELLPDAGRKIVSLFLKEDPFRQFYALRVSLPAFLTEQFTAMSDAWNARGPLSRLKLKTCFYAVVHELYSELLSGIPGRMEIDSFEYARHYLGENYDHACSVQMLAESLGVSRAALHEQFKSNIGIGPRQYLMQLRLDAACKELMFSSMTIDEIAASCGLRDKTYFSRVFKQRYGISPGVFRKNTEKKAPVGRIYPYYGIPRRIVCLDYAAAEMCAALGAAERLVGIAAAENALWDCAEEYRQALAKAPFLPGRSAQLDVPDLETVLSCRPDIVIGTGYSFNQYGGVARAEAFEQRGIRIYALKATCALGCGFESVYEDIRNLGEIFGIKQRAELLVQQMHAKEKELDLLAARYHEPVRVFSFDALVADKAITCGLSLENHIIKRAGGINIFGDRKRQFDSVDWTAVAKADPQAIIVHCFHTWADGLQKAAFLKRVREIEHTEAMRNHRLYIVGIKKVFPGLDNVDTAYELCKWLHER